MKKEPTILDTIELAKIKHGEFNATDKSGSVPYYWHLLRVMLRLKNVNDDNVAHIAILHDIVEDTDVTLEQLRDFGYNEKIIEGVKWCSRNMFPELNFTQWMKKIGHEAPIEAILVKIADISDNLGFERMNGLRNKGQSKINKSKLSQYPLQQRIDKKVKKNMRLSGEMGVYDRYYKGWNNIFENQELINNIKLVNIKDFCNLDDLLDLMSYLSDNEKKEYLVKNNIHTWQIKAKVQCIYTRSGLPYLALEVPHKIGQLYQSFLESKIDSKYMNNQKYRDSDHFHITIIDPMRYEKLIKDCDSKNIIDNFIGSELLSFTYGIGTVLSNKDDKQAWFVIVDNPELKNFREKLNLSIQDFHITLAFNKSDVFGQPKDKSSQCYSNQEIWEHWNKPQIEVNKKIQFK